MNPALNPTLVLDGAGLEKVRDFISRVTEYCPDLETNIVNFYQDRRIRTVQIGNRAEQYVIDLLAFADGKTERLIASQGNFGVGIDPCLAPVIEILKPSLESKSHLKIGQNIGFEYSTLNWCFGIRAWHFYGTDIAEKLLLAGLVNPFAKDHFAMDDLCRKYLWLLIDKTEQKSFDLENPLTQKQVVYAALDTRLPLSIRNAQLPLLRKAGLETVAQIEFDAVGPFEDLHINGIFLNRDKWMELVEIYKENHVRNVAKLDEFFLPLVGQKGAVVRDLDALEEVWKSSPNKTPEEKIQRALHRQAWQAARKEMTESTRHLDSYEGQAAINYGSNPQLLAALQGKAKGINKTTLPSTGDEILKKLAGKFPVIDALREFRTTNKELDTYGEEFLRHINPATNRVHSRISSLGAATGRTSSIKPNIQNLKKEPEVRACFQARPGYKVLTVDMSGAELRIIAELAISKTWIEAFNKKQDVHSVGAAILFPSEWPEAALIGGELLKIDGVDTVMPPCAYYTKDFNGEIAKKQCKCPTHKKLRNKNKSNNFLLAYGGGPGKLADELGITVDEAIELMGLHKGANPEVHEHLDRSGKMAALNLESRTMSGRRRLYKRPDWKDATLKAMERAGKGIVPTQKQVQSALRGMFGAIEREGKNTPIQGSNADMIKLAMGCGFDKDGKPYLWHILQKFGAFLVNMVHDELVIECLPEFAEECFEAVVDAFRRAGATFFKYITMEADGHIADCWVKG